jgi:hypothetical protein
LTFTDKLFAAHDRLVRYLLADDEVQIPRDSVIIFRDDADREFSSKTADLALGIRSRERSKKELAKPAVIVDVTGSSLHIQPIDWEDLSRLASQESSSASPRKRTANG